MAHSAAPSTKICIVTKGVVLSYAAAAGVASCSAAAYFESEMKEHEHKSQ